MLLQHSGGQPDVRNPTTVLYGPLTCDAAVDGNAYSYSVLRDASTVAVLLLGHVDPSMQICCRSKGFDQVQLPTHLLQIVVQLVVAAAV